ncbi:putative formin-like protein 3-like [Capsicum annuum]|nr:putative formin-like protein 3-like [Capsicum annuum]
MEDIYELRYIGNRKVHLFKCHWWDVARLGRRYKIDKYGFTSVNTKCVLNTNEPFVLASQSEQVFYLNDLVDKDWLIILKTNPRDLFNVPEVERETSLNDEVYQQDKVEDILCGNNLETEIEMSLHRDDVEAETVLRTNAQEMRGSGQGKSGRGGTGRGRGHGSFPERVSSETTCHPQIQPIGVIAPSLETIQSSSPSQGPLQIERISSGPIQRISPETQSSRNLDENVRLSVEAETGAVRCVRKEDLRHVAKATGATVGQLHQLIIEQQSEEIENPMTSDMILSSVLGVRSGYVRGKGHGKKPLKKSQMQQANIESSVSSAVESMRQEM